MTTKESGDNSGEPNVTGERRRSRPRRTFVALAAAAIVGGGVLTVARSAVAEDNTEATTAEVVTTAAQRRPGWGTGNIPGMPSIPGMSIPSGFSGSFGGAMPAEFSKLTDCLSEKLGVKFNAGAGMQAGFGAVVKTPPEELRAAFKACAGNLPAGYGAGFGSRSAMGSMLGSGILGSGMPVIDETTKSCLKEKFGASMGGHGQMAGAAVMTPEGVSMRHFGEGDGTITITKAGDKVTVTQTGDVDEISLDDLTAKFGDMMHKMGDVTKILNECGVSLPEGFTIPTAPAK